MKINSPFDYTNRVIDTDTLTSSEKLVALVIARHFNWVDENPAFPGNELLAIKASMHVRTVIRAKKGLIEKGWLSSERRYNNSNLYIPMIPVSDSMPRLDKVSDTMSLGGWHDVTSGGDTEYQLTDKITDNLKDKNNEIKKSEGILLDNLSLDITKYLDNDISLNKIKEEVEDKETYFLILKERKLAGIF
jgi:hypothetical protein